MEIAYYLLLPMNDSCDVSGAGTFETRVITPDEFDAYRVLLSKKFDLIVQQVDPELRLAGKATPDVVLEDEQWELKCPNGNNAKKTIGRNINKAIRQMHNSSTPDKVNIILSALATSLPSHIVVNQARASMSKGLIDNMIVIANEGRLIRMKKDGQEEII